MALIAVRDYVGRIFKKEASAIAYAAETEGLVYNENDQKLKTHIQGQDRELVTGNQTQDLDNKTLNSPVLDGVVSGTIVDTNIATADVTFDDHFPSTKAVKQFVEDTAAAQDDASEITYTEADNADWDGDPSNVKEGLDELASRVREDETNTDDLVTLSGVAENATDLGTFTGDTIADSRKNKEALQDLETAHEEVDQNVDDLVTLSGVAENATDLGTFTGDTIADSRKNKEALQDLETAHEEVDQNVDDLVTLSGVAENATDLGTFTGSTISDSRKNKEALQDLETAHEAHTADDALSKHDADQIDYDNTDSGLAATKAQAAIDELASTGGASFVGTQASHDFELLDPIYHNGTSWVLARANDDETLAEYVVTKTDKATTNTTFTGTKFGKVNLPSHGKTVGEHYFLDDDVYATNSGSIITQPPNYSNPLFYVEDADNVHVEVYRPSIVSSAGGASGSAGGGLDVFYTESFTDPISGWSNGVNSTFLGADGGGSTAPDDEGTNPISGIRSVKHVNTTQFDYGAAPSVELDDKQKGNWIGMVAYTLYDGDDDDYDLVLYDDTNGAVLNRVAVKASTQPLRHVIAAYVPTTCSNLRWGYHLQTTNATKELFIDDIEFSTDPFVYKELSNDLVAARYDTAFGQPMGSGLKVVVDFETTDFGYDTHNAVTTGSGWKFTCPVGEAGYYHVSSQIAFAFGSGIFDDGEQAQCEVWRNGIYVSRLGATKAIASSADQITVQVGGSTELYLAEGDYIQIKGFQNDPLSVNLTNNEEENWVSITKAAPSVTEHVVTPSMVPKTYTEADTGTITGTNDWATEHTEFIPYVTGDGEWRLKLNIGGGITSNTTTTITIPGIVVKTPDVQPLAAMHNSANWSSAYAQGGGNTITLKCGVATTSYRCSGDIPLASKPTWADSVSSQYLAAVPKVRYQEKFLDSNKDTTGVMSDLTFSNLTVGRKYKIAGQIMVTWTSPANENREARIQVDNGATLIAQMVHRQSNSTSISNMNIDKVFDATDTTLTFDLETITTNSFIQSSNDSTFLRLEDVTDQYVETTEW